jgi:large subunit ribosomal protein L36
MKAVSSIKNARKRDKDCKLVKRGKKLYVINKKNPRMKAKQ